MDGLEVVCRCPWTLTMTARDYWTTALYFALHTCIWADITMFECGRTLDMASQSVGQREVPSKFPTFAMTVGMVMALYV